MDRRREGSIFHPGCSMIFPTSLLMLAVFIFPLFAAEAEAETAFLVTTATTKYREQQLLHHNHLRTSSSTNNNRSLTQLSLASSSSSHGRQEEDIYAAVHRKEYEMKRLHAQHTSLSDPVRMAMGYVQDGVEKKRLAAALRRVHDDPDNIANPNFHARRKTDDEISRDEKLLQNGLAEPTMRRGSFIVDIKRKSTLSYPHEKQFARYDDAGLVAEAMVRLGADVVFVNVDYPSYGGDMNELKSAISSVRRVNDYAAVVMKDIVVDELQLGLAKEAGADGILLMASVLGPALENFLNLATIIGLETIVECHTYNEVQAALDALAQNIMVSNRDRITGQLLPDQAIKLAGMSCLAMLIAEDINECPL